MLKVVIRTDHQTLSLWEEDRLLTSFPVSTSKYGVGTESGSHKTPSGHFRVCEKIGGEHPARTVFVGRRAVQEAWDWESADDLITSRILWLEGTEDSNANTRERYIYIHGTNQEHLIGQPASHGCIRMRNGDVVTLFDLVACGTPVEITR